MLMATTLMAGEKNEAKNNDAKFSLSINQKSLDRFLMMDEDQKVEMDIASRRLARDLKKAKNKSAVKQSTLLRKAIARNLQTAHRVLYRDQYRDYVTVLNFSMNNKGLTDILYQADLAEK